jgi:hypothetical protein
MKLTEIAAILLGLLAGYWAVSMLFFRTPPPKEPPKPGPPPVKQTPWYEILEVSEFAGTEAIREAYKRQIAKYHPDKVDTLGQELKDLASRKSQDINAAYRDAMRSRGLEP